MELIVCWKFVSSYYLDGNQLLLTLVYLYLFKKNYFLGFALSSEAKHVAEITSKMANFVIETDTEVSAGPTDTGEIGPGSTDTGETDPGYPDTGEIGPGNLDTGEIGPGNPDTGEIGPRCM